MRAPRRPRTVSRTSSPSGSSVGSVSVSVSMEREFAGSDPKFRQLVGHDDWSQYVDAFAPYPA